MKSIYHRGITENAFKPHFSRKSLSEIVKANIRQDQIRYQFGHDHYHFDNSCFDASHAYLDRQQNIFRSSLKGGNLSDARRALGRMTHTWQDFYSHSNYVKLWLEQYGWHAPNNIDPEDPAILTHKRLISGKIYGWVEFAALLPGLSRILTPMMPEDSHARMNLDHPKSGPLFIFAYQAALKKTRSILNELRHWMQAALLDTELTRRFFDKENDK